MSHSVRRQAFLYLLTASQAFGFVIWAALLKNFIKQDLGLDGLENAWLETVREVPGFLAFTTVFLLAYVREQRLAVLSTLVLGVGVAVSGFASNFTLLMAATFLMSVGFHYYQTIYKSLSLQWFDDRKTPIILGRVVSVSNATTLVALGLFWLLFFRWDFSFASGYLLAGLVTFFGGLVALLGFHTFPAITTQRDTLVLRWPYLLYYVLTFLSGARRQIFIVFATFILVDIFDLAVTTMLALLFFNAAINMGTGLLLGPAINRFGERAVLQVEYAGLVIVFLAYGVCLAFADARWALPVVLGLYVIDHVLFQFSIGIESYFKKIADPADLQGSAGVSFTINHIAAVTLPPALGLIYVGSGGVKMGFASAAGPSLVFWVGASLALASLVATFWMRRYPRPVAR